MRVLASCLALCACLSAHAQPGEPLVGLINEFRASARQCQGRRVAQAPALAPQPVLAALTIGPGTFLENAIRRAGLRVARAERIALTAPVDAAGALAYLGAYYCKTLMDPAFRLIGVRHAGNEWQVILAQPAPPPPESLLPGAEATGRLILDAVNRARTVARSCGARAFAPAAPLQWNAALGDAALVHSQDMARHRAFDHRGTDGRLVADRALAAGYTWDRIAENIAVGQGTPDEVVNGWLGSPGHCSNIMGDFRDMGAAYAVAKGSETTRIYWTQVFGITR